MFCFKISWHVKRPSKLQRPDGSKQHFKIVYSRSHGLERTRLLENGENHLLRQKSRLRMFWILFDVCVTLPRLKYKSGLSASHSLTTWTKVDQPQASAFPLRNGERSASLEWNDWEVRQRESNTFKKREAHVTNCDSFLNACSIRYHLA